MFAWCHKLKRSTSIAVLLAMLSTGAGQALALQTHCSLSANASCTKDRTCCCAKRQPSAACRCSTQHESPAIPTSGASKHEQFSKSFACVYPETMTDSATDAPIANQSPAICSPIGQGPTLQSVLCVWRN
jgi:hypothetical protein